MAAEPLVREQGVRPGTGIRDLFPRLRNEVFLNAAAGTPLGSFAQEGLQRYLDYWRLGPGGGRGDYFEEMMSQIRPMFARLIGSLPEEIGMVHCTKAGEQVVLEGLHALRNGGNVVTNDMHFTGSLHNLEGLRRAGLDVRIVRATDWDVPLEAMEAAIDDRTSLVAVTLISNINGRVEPLRKLSDIAHAHGAYVYADIIQAAGIVPIDVQALGIDFAACSGYKWLFGPHGVGFIFVREGLQGTVLEDHLFPGHVTHNYQPWVARSDSDHDDFVYMEPTDARRYQPGHMSYLGYCALYEGLKFIDRIGVEAARRHSVRLARRLEEGLDPERYRSISPHIDQVPIATFLIRDGVEPADRLRDANIVTTLTGNRIRVSPAVFNNEEDIDLISEVLNRVDP